MARELHPNLARAWARCDVVKPRAPSLPVPAECPGGPLPAPSCVVDDDGWDDALEEVVLHCHGVRERRASYETAFRCSAAASGHLWRGGYFHLFVVEEPKAEGEDEEEIGRAHV